MVQDLPFYQCLLKSWQSCMEKGVPQDIEKPLINLTFKQLNAKLKLKNEVIQIFNNFIDKYLNLTQNIKGSHYFAFLDNEENLLAVRRGLDASERGRNDNSFLATGVSFNERSMGTNAVSLSKLLKRAIYMCPNFNYCNKLKNWHQYCVPIGDKGNTTGYVSVISIGYPISKALEGFIDLMAVNIYEDLYTSEMQDYLYSDLKERLTEKQYLILKMIAQGLTDTHISKEMKMSLSTVKYHNQSIFKALNANSRVDAVVKALANNDLSIFDICSGRS